MVGLRFPLQPYVTVNKATFCFEETISVPNLSSVLSGHGESFKFHMDLLSPNFVSLCFAWLSLQSPVAYHLIHFSGTHGSL